jgi:Domain of unknown function (DUF4265)
VVTGVAARSGHSTYGLALPEDTNEEKFLQDWVRLKELGGTYERAARRFVAIDVPPHADIYAVYEALEEGERASAWEFEEGHLWTLGTQTPFALSVRDIRHRPSAPCCPSRRNQNRGRAAVRTAFAAFQHGYLDGVHR